MLEISEFEFGRGMTACSEDALKAHQWEVQRLLGRCLVRLQQYERLLKAIVAGHEVSGPAPALKVAQATRKTETASKTLGTLVNELLGSCFVTDDVDTPSHSATDPIKDTITFSYRQHRSDADLDKVKARIARSNQDRARPAVH